MTTRQQVLNVAAKLGATVEIRQGGGWPEVLCEAPRGFIWDDGDGIHEQVNAGRRGESITSLYAEAVERMMCGVVPCDIPDCEWCADRRAEVTA